MTNYEEKYLKYKIKYFKLKEELNGGAGFIAKSVIKKAMKTGINIAKKEAKKEANQQIYDAKQEMKKGINNAKQEIENKIKKNISENKKEQYTCIKCKKENNGFHCEDCDKNYI
jgi:hypothetical protein